MTMKEDKTATKRSSNKENESVLENGKKKSKEEKPATKVVVRRLPPTMTEEQFKMQVAPLPDFDYFYFVPADMSLSPNSFCRAYINFMDQSDLFIFTQKFDGYVFIDSKGGEFPAVVEFAPFQRIPKIRPNRKKDPKIGTIEAEPVYIAFKERLEAHNLEKKATANAAKQHFFETSLIPEKKELNNTPLLDYIKNRRAERQKVRDEKREEKRKKDLERRKAKEEQKRIKKEDETSVVKVLNSPSANKERLKEKEAKPTFVKKKSDETKPTSKEKSSTEYKSKENKPRTGKSYLEERQRQAERREEQKRKLIQSQSSTVTETQSETISDDKPGTTEDKNSSEQNVSVDTKEKDTEYKKSERVLRKEESRKNSTKYASNKDREPDEMRRTRRTNSDRIHQASRRDDERSEDGGRKKYYESRKNHDSTPRDRYKDKDKSKTYGQKKSSGSASDINKSKYEPEKIDTKVKSDSTKSLNEETDKSICSAGDVETNTEDIKEPSFTPGARNKALESNQERNTLRRKSLDCEKNKLSLSYSSNIINDKEKYSEKKRRNSVGSSKHNECTVVSSHKYSQENTLDGVTSAADTLKVKVLKDESYLSETNNVYETEIKKNSEQNKIKIVKEEVVKEEIPKRRNSTGERQNFEKVSLRRKSLGSGDENIVYSLKEDTFNNDESSKVEKSPKKTRNYQRGSDPRTERRIRNKDRPSIAIYRPGMGKFSKQRLEREKVVGSSTEVESPSSSPSPTPVLKHKSLSLH